MRLIVVGSVIVILLGVSALAAQDLCQDIVKNASQDVGITSNSSDYLVSIFKKYCESDGTVNQSSLSVGVSIPDIPVSLSLGSSNSDSKMTNFCKNYSSSSEAHNSTYSYQSSVVAAALDAAVQCAQIEKSGSFVTYTARSQTPDTLSITFHAGTGGLKIYGISHHPNVTCIGPARRPLPGQSKYDGGTTRELSANDAILKVDCTRTPASTNGGTTIYDAAAVGVSTNFGGLDIYWPKNPILPVTDANVIQANLQALQQQADQAKAFDQMIDKGARQDVAGGIGAGNSPGTSNIIYCQPGFYLAGITLVWGADGRLQGETPICRQLLQGMHN